MQAPDNIFVRDQIVPKVMRRLVATGNATDLALCVKFIAGLKDGNSREKALDGLVIALDKQTVTPPEGWAKLQDEITRAEKELTETRDELSNLGVVLLDDGRGRVGFPTMVNNRRAYFSWQLGEESGGEPDQPHEAAPVLRSLSEKRHRSRRRLCR